MDGLGATDDKRLNRARIVVEKVICQLTRIGGPFCTTFIYECYEEHANSIIYRIYCQMI